MARVEEKDMALWPEQHANVNWVQVVEQQRQSEKSAHLGSNVICPLLLWV